MSLFADLPLKRKLMLIGIITNGVAVVVLSLALGIGEWANFRSRAATALPPLEERMGGRKSPFVFPWLIGLLGWAWRHPGIGLTWSHG